MIDSEPIKLPEKERNRERIKTTATHSSHLKLLGKDSVIQNSPQSAGERGLFVIALFKLFKGFVLLAIGIGALKLMHRNVADQIEHWADAFRIDPSNYFLHRLLVKFGNLDGRKLKELSVGTFIYAALLTTEGTGLLLRKRWAEYFTVIVTSSFIPLEIYELARRLTLPRVLVLAINLAIVGYLVMALRRVRRPVPNVQAA